MSRLLSIYGIVIIYIILSATVLTPSNVPFYNTLVVPVIWIGIASLSYYLATDKNNRIRNMQDKVLSLLIVMIIYIIIYFAAGLFLGFQKTPYAKEILSVFKNLWAFGSIIFLEEVTRNALIRLGKKKVWNYIIITILFILVQINLFSLFSSLVTVKSSFVYISSIIVPIIANNILLTYLSYIGGIKLPIIYRVFITIPQFIVPIVPDLNWFLTAAIGLILPIVVYIYLNYIHVKYVERMNKRTAKKYNPVGYVPVFTILIFLILFVVGAFKYQPIAVVSGSMSPYFNRGDAVIIEKLNNQEKNELKEGDVIQFAKGDRYYIHRIVEIKTDQYLNREFVTKGDFNNVIDGGTVSYDKVVGKLQFIVPYIGYPSVWLSETLE